MPSYFVCNKYQSQIAGFQENTDDANHLTTQSGSFLNIHMANLQELRTNLDFILFMILLLFRKNFRRFSDPGYFDLRNTHHHFSKTNEEELIFKKRHFIRISFRTKEDPDDS